MARKPSSNRTMVAIEMFGLDEFLRELRFAPAETKKAVKQGNKVIADKVVVEMTKRARVVFHAQQYQTILPSLRAVQGTVPQVKIGGARPKANVSRRKNRPAPGEFVLGVEFGARRRGPRTRQFPMAKRGGFVLFPTIHKLHGFIKKEYSDNIEKVLRKVAR